MDIVHSKEVLQCLSDSFMYQLHCCTLTSGTELWHNIYKHPQSWGTFAPQTDSATVPCRHCSSWAANGNRWIKNSSNPKMVSRLLRKKLHFRVSAPARKKFVPTETASKVHRHRHRSWKSLPDDSGSRVQCLAQRVTSYKNMMNFIRTDIWE